MRVLPGNWLQDSYSLQGLGHFWQGRWEEAEATHLKSLEYTQPWIWNPTYPGFVFLVRAYLGKREEAMAMLPTLEPMLPTLDGGHPLGAWSLAVNMAEGFWILGEYERAHSLYPLVTEPARRGARVLYGSRLVQVSAGIASAAGGMWEAAEEHFGFALAEARRVHNQVEEADTLRFRAMMVSRRGADGDGQRARQDLDAAQGLYQEIGMQRHADMTGALLSET